MNTTFRHLIVVLTVSFFCQTVSAITRYASPTGSDANGTSPDQPGSFTALVKKLQAGDTLLLLDGQYDMAERCNINVGGTADNYITIESAPGAKAILDFRTVPNGTNALCLRSSYVHLKNFTIRYSGYKGLWLEGAKYCIVENIEVYGCCDSGIQLRSGGYNMVINCDSHHNFDYQNESPGENADGFADKQGEACPGNIYIGCRSWCNSDDGWDMFQRVTTDNKPTVFINCITYNNGLATYDLSENPRATGVDSHLFAGKDLHAIVNKGNRNGFKLGGKQTVHDAELYRCLAIGHAGSGFEDNSNVGTMKIVNSTAYHNLINYSFGYSLPYSLDIHNCISLQPTGGSDARYHLATGGNITQSHNSWNSGFSASAADFESLDMSLATSPRQADGSLPEILLLHLKPTASQFIDKGMMIEAYYFTGDSISSHVSYTGDAPDLGCYEYSSSASAISPLTIETDNGGMHATAPRYDLTGHRVYGSFKGIVVQLGRKYYQR
ncbi:MAG: right-handed parallel beta-helix repeat-containing protein [Prevotella sp.]